MRRVPFAPDAAAEDAGFHSYQYRKLELCKAERRISPASRADRTLGPIGLLDYGVSRVPRRSAEEQRTTGRARSPRRRAAAIARPIHQGESLDDVESGQSAILLRIR